MKQLFSILFFFSLAATAQNKHAIAIGSGTGTTGSAGAWYNIKTYGANASAVSISEFRVATSSNKINATAGIQAAINAAHAAGGGIVYIPAGHYYTNQLESYTDVTLMGDGYMSTFIHALGDTTIAIHALNAANSGAFGSSLTNGDLFRGLRFEGDSIGKIGLYMDRPANFNISNLYFQFYLTTAMHMTNMLIGTIADCRFYYNTKGIVSTANIDVNGASNHVKLRGLVMVYHKKWAVDWSGGGLVDIDFCDFEVNGSNGDTTTGSIYYHDNPWPKGLNVSNTWFEENQGTNIYIGPNVSLSNFNQPGPTVHNMYGNNDQGHHYDFLNRNIYIKGTNQQLNIYSCMIWGASGGKNIVIDGTNNIVKTYGVVWSNNNPAGANNVVRLPASSSITNN